MTRERAIDLLRYAIEVIDNAEDDSYRFWKILNYSLTMDKEEFAEVFSEEYANIVYSEEE